MWGFANDSALGLHSAIPPITITGFIYIAIALVGLRAILQRILVIYFKISAARPQHHINSLEYSYFYHLSIVVLVLAEVNWNMFDLAVWVGSYVGVGLIRKAIHVIRIQKQIILNDYSYNTKIITILSASKIFGLILFCASLAYFLVVQTIFEGVSVRLSSLLLFPTMMLAVDSFFLLVSSTVSQTEILSYFNPNINEIPSIFRVELIQKMVGSSVRLWHYYNLTRLFVKAFFQRMGVLDCVWILSVLNAGYLSANTFYKSFKKYRSYSKLLENLNRIFQPSSPAIDQNCVICMSELLNCRRLNTCGHLFHYKCLFQWIQTKTDCPVCRSPIILVDQ